MYKMMMMGATLMAFASLSFAAAGAPTGKSAAKNNPEARFMQKSMAMTRIKLNDPQSAKFREVFVNKASNGAPVTCGEVNSKNNRGEFGGFQKFVSAGTPDLTFLQADVPAFDQIWKQYCA